jgi:hypothetical protein
MNRCWGYDKQPNQSNYASLHGEYPTIFLPRYESGKEEFL